MTDLLRRIIGFIDWRFLIALALLVGVGAAVHGALAAGQERDRVIAAAATERREASVERDRLLAGQRDLSNKYERLIRWLNSQHIVVPPEVLNGRTTVRVDNDDSDDSDDNDDNGTTPRPTTPARTSSPPPRNGGGGSDDGGSKSGTAATTQNRSSQSRSPEHRNPGRGVTR